ncbi:glutamic acid-rich protein-like [Chenopodium quinoa]|uniref:glutamic acid-rich protein-like n=1 Tax=Chenopodium quinoa TaxID=63459 RepID=UPI000B79138E|nr:glutamic acid-rich protein-like [Chenopodium quinoa]
MIKVDVLDNQVEQHSVSVNKVEESLVVPMQEEEEEHNLEEEEEQVTEKEEEEEVKQDDNDDEDDGEADEYGFKEEVNENGGHQSFSSGSGNYFSSDEEIYDSESSIDSDAYRRSPRNFDENNKNQFIPNGFEELLNDGNLGVELTTTSKKVQGSEYSKGSSNSGKRRGRKAAIEGNKKK